MVRGAECTFTAKLTNKVTGLPITDPLLIDSLELMLKSSKENKSLVKLVEGSGITSLGNGEFRIKVTSENSLLLPTEGRAFLEGFTLPVKKSITFDLGVIKDNQLNYPVK